MKNQQNMILNYHILILQKIFWIVLKATGFFSRINFSINHLNV